MVEVVGRRVEYGGGRRVVEGGIGGGGVVGGGRGVRGRGSLCLQQ